MHRQLKKLLEKAEGRSEFVIAINLDIRGFSAFSQKVESTDAAVFIKKVYLKLVEDYFTDISYFKPTGDGLFMIKPYTEENLEEVVGDIVDTCLNAIKDFGSFCENDPMVNFEVPTRIGIGLARGSACCLTSETKILDYSGRVLNLASRLMDFARPSGIVFDQSFDISLLPEHLIKLFAQDEIFIKGIAEREPVGIFYTKEYTEITPLSKHPIQEVSWVKRKEERTLKHIRNLAPRYVCKLPSAPVKPDEIKLKVTHAGVVSGRKTRLFQTSFEFTNFKYYLEAGEPRVVLDIDLLVERLVRNEVKDSWPVQIEIIYPEK